MRMVALLDLEYDVLVDVIERGRGLREREGVRDWDDPGDDPAEWGPVSDSDKEDDETGVSERPRSDATEYELPL